MMKKLCLLLSLCLFLTGCDSSKHLENKAHAISIGIDLMDEQIQLSVQVPTIGGESLAGDSGAGAATYAIYSATADDFPAAYNLLIATLPERLNLTQLKSIIICEDLARSERFSPLIEALFRVYALSAASTVIISRTPAREMLENQRAFIGTHLSVSMPAMLGNYASYGYIPLTSLSLLYAGMNSVYSTAKAALGSVSRADYADGQQTALAGSLNRQGENRNEYMGCALFDRQKMVGLLDGYETQLAGFLAGSDITIDSMPRYSGLTLNLRKKPAIRIDCQAQPVAIDIALDVLATPITPFSDFSQAATFLARDIEEVIAKCQQMSVEPFRFAERAAGQFSTMREWEDFAWLKRFSEAKVSVSVRMQGSE